MMRGKKNIGSEVSLSDEARAAERRTTVLTIIILGTSLFIMFVICMISGRYSIAAADMVPALFHGLFNFLISILELPAKLPFIDYHIANPIEVNWEGNIDIVLWTVRLPRIITAFLVGGSLSIVGASYQGVFQNPLVSDGILGVSAGAGFGAALALGLDMSMTYAGAAAFIGASAAVFLTYISSRMFTGNPTLLLVLTGTVVSSLFSALLSLVEYLVPPDTKLPTIVFWLMGSFARIKMNSVYVLIPVLLISSFLLYLMRWRLNILSLGDNMAYSLGVNPQRTRLFIIIVSTFISAVVVAYCGTIGWMGIVIPQVTRMIVGPDNRRLLPTCFFAGALFMMFVDLICRAWTEADIPIGIVTSIVGAPLYLIILRRVRKGWL